MATFNYVVDTQPMAEKVSTVSSHVKGTTGAVIAMQTAVIAAEKIATEHVCSNLNRGFYTLIRSQLSQKIAKMQSDVDSHLMQLTQQQKSLRSIQHRMERDYNMISKRYAKLFNGLNANLEHRVYELDKPMINFAVKEVEKVSNRPRYLTATVPIVQDESLVVSQKMMTSHLKNKAMYLIKSMSGFLMEMTEQKLLTDQILINDVYSQPQGFYYLPVMVCESVRSEHQKEGVEVITPEVSIPLGSATKIRNKLVTEYSDLKWGNEHAQEIDDTVVRLIDDSEQSKRIKELAIKLYKSTNFQTTQNK